MSLIDHTGNGSKKKFSSHKNKKRKRCEEMEEEAEEEFPSTCSNTEDIRADHGTEHQLRQLKAEQKGRQHGKKLCNNTTSMWLDLISSLTPS